MIIERLSRWLVEEPVAGNAAEEEDSARCYAYIYMALEPRWQREINTRMVDAPMSAMAVWNFLLEEAVGELHSHELAYTTQLNTLKQGSTQSITAYLEEAEKVSVRLQIINRPVDTRTLILRIVQGLSPAYEAIRDALVLASANYDTISKLRAALLALEVAKTDQDNSKMHAGLSAQQQRPRAFGRNGAASTSGRFQQQLQAGRSQQAGEFHGDCNYCGQPGHDGRLQAEGEKPASPTRGLRGWIP
jgi:hypothetical protein